MTRGELLETIDALFGDSQWPKPFHVLKAVSLVDEGATLREAAREVGTTVRALEAAVESEDAVRQLLHLGLREVTVPHRGGQLRC